MTKVHEQLQALIDDHSEREDPIAFVGRDSIIRDVLRIANRMSVDRPKKGQTFVISGAPGAGKTALLAELSTQWRPHASIVSAEVPGESKVRWMWGRLAEQLTGTPTNNLRGEIHEETTVNAGMSAIVQGTISRKEGMTVPPLVIDSCAQIRELADGEFQGPVIVCIDEIQNIRSDTSAARLVRELHTQSDAPVLLVCAGLGNSEQRLDDIGVSRSTRIHNILLGGLQPAETLVGAREALKVIAATAQIDPDRLVERFAEKIAKASDNWPKHLTCYLHGVCRALVEQQRPSPEGLNPEKTLEFGHQLRQEYYQERFDASLAPAQALSAIYERIGDQGLTRKECINLLDRHLRSTDDVEFKESFASGREAFEQVLRAGVLTLHGRNRCEIPIPTLESFVNDLMRREQQQL